MPISACTSSICFLSKYHYVCACRDTSRLVILSLQKSYHLYQDLESFSKNFLFQRAIRLLLCRLSNKGRFFCERASNSLSKTSDSRSPISVSSSYVAETLVKLVVSLEKLF